MAQVDLEQLRVEVIEYIEVSPIVKSIEEGMLDATSFLADIAKHPQVSVEILEHLTAYPNPTVHLAVAQNPKTPEQLRKRLLQELADSSNIRVKIKLASTQNIPVEIIEKLAGVSSSIDTMTAFLRQLAPNITDSLLEKIRKFIDKYQSPELILFWMRQGKEFYIGTLQEWDEIVNSLEESEKTILEYLTTQEWTGEWEGKFTAIRKGRGRSRDLPKDERLAALYHQLESLLDLLNMPYNSDRSNEDVIAALLGNPSTPAALRSRLWEQSRKTPDELRRYLQMASAFNPNVSEPERHKYFQDLIATGSDTGEKLAKDPQTPAYILEKLAESLDDTIRYYVAKNLSTPTATLIKLTDDTDRQVKECALKNPNTPQLEAHKQMQLGVYRLSLGLNEVEETAKAHELMARRTDSPYALLQVLEKGDRNAKLTAARSNKTPIQVLEQLAKDTDETVRQVVLQNPNLPLHSLLELAKDESVNVRLWLAYNSSPHKTQKPVQLLEQLAQDTSEQVRARVAGLSETPVDILARLANDSSRDVKVAVTGNPNTPVTVLTRLGLEEDIVNQRNPNTPGMVLNQAVNTMNGESLANFIKHPVKGSQMPGETLARLVTHGNSSVRYRVAAHPNTPTSALEQLACDSYVPTLRALADNPNTPPHVLAQLANTSDLTTRLSIVRNPNTPAQVLAQIVLSTQNSGNQPNRTVDALKSAIAGSHNDLLRTIASNPRTPMEALEILARREFASATQDPQSIIPPTTNDSVVQSLTYNPSLTPQLLHILAQDPCVDVRVSLTRHPNLTEALWMQLARDEALTVREAVAVHREAPERVLELLARDEQGEVRVKVATNPNTEIAILVSLASDENSAVRTAVASHPSLPTAQLESLSQDEKVEVRRAVAQNPRTSASIRETLQELLSPPQTKQTSPTLRGLPRLYNPQTDDLVTVLSEYARSPNAFVRLVTLLHPLTSSEILQQGAKSVSWLERYAVAENSATAIELRQQLAEDSNQIVRVVAKAHLST